MYISIIIPAYNEEKNIPHLIKSLRAQTEKDFEIIVIDNNSKDKTFKISEKLADRTYKCYEQGISPARNFGAKKARGKILAFIDADCTADKNWVKSIKKGFENKDVSVMSGRTYTDYKIWYKRLLANFTYFCGFAHMKILTYFGIPAMMAPNIAIRKDLFRKVGGFDKVIIEDHFLTEKLRKLRGIKSKMDYKMKVICSARRMEKEGIIKTWLFWYSASFKKVNSDKYKLHDKL